MFVEQAYAAHDGCVGLQDEVKLSGPLEHNNPAVLDRGFIMMRTINLNIRPAETCGDTTASNTETMRTGERPPQM